MADDDASLHFGQFSLHPVQGLMRDEQEVRVTPRSLDLLICLAARAGEIITKDELFRSVWHDRVVTDAALTTCIRELRHALGDDARRPRYIETVHRRGYRFLATPVPLPSPASITTNGGPIAAALAPPLEQLLRLAGHVGEGGTVAAMLVGPAGSGKTTLMQTFLTALAEAPQPWQICTTGCNDNAGPGDAFRPLLDLLTQLTEAPGNLRAATVLSNDAPSWFAELPVHLTRREARLLRLRASGATRGRRNRELFEALTTLSATGPVVLVVEDVQHCDAATADCLAQFAGGCRADALLIVTCREEELSSGSAFHDFRDSCPGTLLALEPAAATEPQTTTDCLRAFNKQALRVLESACIAGKRFSAAEAAAGAGVSIAEADAQLAQLSEAGRGIRCGSRINWPDGTTTRTFEFADQALRTAILQAVPVPRRAAAHRRVARRLERAFGDRAGDIAAQLAIHHELSGDFDHALVHHYAAAVVARRRSAPEVALVHFRRALALVPSLAASQQRDLWEADLLVAIGRELVIAHGLTCSEANAAYQRALELHPRIEDGPALNRVLWGLWVYLLNRGPLDVARQVADRLLELARANGDTDELLQAHHAMWGTSLMLGDVNAVLDHARRGIALCAAEADAPLKMTTGCTFHDVHLNDHAAAVCAGFFCAWADALGGRKEAAVGDLNAAISHARDVDHPFTLAVTLTLSAGVMAAANDPGLARRFAEEARSIAGFHGFGLLLAWASVYEGWALARLGEVEQGVGQLLDALETTRALGLTLFRPFQLALAAGVQLDSGELKDATRLLKEAFLICERVGDRLALPELYRIRGELRMQTAASTATLRRAASDLHQARDIATEQGATLLAAKATASLQRLQGRLPG